MNSDHIEFEHLETAMKHALMDSAVVQFASLDLLLRQLSKDLQPAVRAAVDRYQPFLPGLSFFLGHARLAQVPDGRWGVAKCTGAHAGYWLLIASNERRYREAIRQINTVLMAQEQSIGLN